MTDAEHEKQKARIQKLIEEWVRPLGLGWWHIQFVYSREPIQGTVNYDQTGTERCLAQTHTHWQYMDGLIEFDLVKVAELDDEGLERCFIHELCHLFVNEMREFGRCENGIRHEERVVSQLTNAFVWLKGHLTEGEKSGKRKGSSRLQSRKRKDSK